MSTTPLSTPLDQYKTPSFIYNLERLPRYSLLVGCSLLVGGISLVTLTSLSPTVVVAGCLTLSFFWLYKCLGRLSHLLLALFSQLVEQGKQLHQLDRDLVKLKDRMGAIADNLVAVNQTLPAMSNAHQELSKHVSSIKPINYVLNDCKIFNRGEDTETFLIPLTEPPLPKEPDLFDDDEITIPPYKPPA